MWAARYTKESAQRVGPLLTLGKRPTGEAIGRSLTGTSPAPGATTCYPPARTYSGAHAFAPDATRSWDWAVSLLPNSHRTNFRHCVWNGLAPQAPTSASL